MAYTNFIFLFIFMPLCVLGYMVVAYIQKKRKKATNRPGDIFLILTSLCFYGWSRMEGVLYFGAYILLVFALGRWIHKACSEKREGMQANRKRLFMAVSVVVLVGILYFYKYFDFTITTVNRLLQTKFDSIYVLIPLGISFITFSAISYIVDIYRGDAPAGNLLETAFYLSFFPKVISGPIVLWKDFQKQMQNRVLNEEYFLQGINRMIIGYGKKVILADSFGQVVEHMRWNLQGGMDIPTAWLCALFYMMQIYYDFSGYSDIALGLSQMFGFQFKENFHFPYVSASITEFWRRWHISLGTWFREYIYIPLGGNRKGDMRTLVNLFVVFAVTGLWHGAGWNYVLWGVINGVCMIVERCIHNKKFYLKTPHFLKWAITMFIVLLSWQIFRIQSVGEIAEFFRLLFGITEMSSVNYSFAYYVTAKNMSLLVIAILGATVLHKKCFLLWHQKISQSKGLLIAQQLLLFGLMILAVIFMVNSTYSPFIYFQY